MGRKYRSLEHTIQDVWINEMDSNWGGFKIGIAKHPIGSTTIDPTELEDLEKQKTQHMHQSFAHTEHSKRLRKQLPFVSEDSVGTYTRQAEQHELSASLHDKIVNILSELIKHKKSL